MRLNTILIALAAISIALCTVLFFSWKSEHTRRIQAEQTTVNFAVFKDSVKNYLVLSTNQIKEIYPKLEQRLKDEFNVKLNNVLQIASTKVTTNSTFKTFVKDSLNLKIDTIPFKYIAYRDSFIDFEASEIQNEMFVTRNIVQVPLTQIISREPWKFKNVFPWNWGKRKIFQDIRSDNPHAVIKYSQIIQVAK
jgi:oligoribonuclease NrnB/cAMP/cGMP phosphodiesterase (DHH superfamily)